VRVVDASGSLDDVKARVASALHDMPALTEALS
jgi:hypothetical protein